VVPTWIGAVMSRSSRAFTTGISVPLGAWPSVTVAELPGLKLAAGVTA